MCTISFLPAGPASCLLASYLLASYLLASYLLASCLLVSYLLASCLLVSYLLASYRDERKSGEPAFSPERHYAGTTRCL